MRNRTMPTGRSYTPPLAAKLLVVNVGKILDWIANGELRASNVGNGSRPRWRIMPDDLQAFLDRRAAKPPTAKSTRRRRKQPAGVIEFF